MTDRKATRKRRLFYWPDAKMAEKISAFAAFLKKIQWQIDGGHARPLAKKPSDIKQKRAYLRR
ncbi:hypothetical protein M2418_000725 [Rhizobium sp. BIGb0125]|uniref:hypothetical protein n=1 Tax=Rhizobium sp. BIGb0125 TaxID=2940618 RepID=UPI0021685046|nr:hypothetical protein [Rhizobium sp. BIGb0125]MCS4241223.1 hypothetical protein [Rhizobium sp. BIGb0125]